MGIKYIFVWLITIQSIMLGVSVPNTFTSGTAAKANEVNENFSTLATKITEIEDKTTYDTEVQANGDTFYINTNGYNHYSITLRTTKDHLIAIDTNGRTTKKTLYYENLDCIGTLYVEVSIYGLSDINSSELKVNYSFKNPNLDKEITLFDANQKLYYTSKKDPLILLNSKSYRYSTGECRNSSSKKLVRQGNENDASVTGINTYPIILSYGEKLKIDQEIGEKDTSNSNSNESKQYKVYANSVEIGYVTSLPDNNDDELYSVKLKDSDYSLYKLSKDGTYSPNSSNKVYLYFLSDDCTGNAYVKVLENYAKEWWHERNTKKGELVFNNKSKYSLSDKLYKFSNGYNSYRYHTGSCNKSSSENNAGFRLATFLENSPLPEKYDTPITIEGYTEEIQLDNLEEAN